MKKQFLLCSWGLITALLTNFAFGQNNFLNTFFDYNGQHMHGNHVKAVQITGSEGYYVAGMYDGSTEAFIAKTDPYGNAYWVRKISNVTKQETVMKVDPANGNVYFSVQVNNRLEIYGFILSGASISTNFPIQLPGDFYPVAIKAFDNGGSNNFGVLSRSQSTNELHLSAFNGMGVVQYGRLYDAPGISANSRSASFVQNTTSNRLIIAYGSDAGTSSIVSFNVDETSGVPTSNYLPQEITDLGGHFGEITVHDIIPAGSDYLIAGSYNQTSMLALMNGTNSVLWSELLIGFIPHPEHQAVSLNTDGSHFFVMALGFSAYPNPASMHFLEVDVVGGLTINIANEIHISSPFSFEGRTHYPTSFAMNSITGSEVVFTAYQYDPSQGTPIVGLDVNLDLNCQVVIHGHGLDPMNVTTPTSLPVPVVNSGFSPVNFSGSASNELPIPNHLCFSCGNTITLNPTVTGGLCAAGGGTANLQANPVGITNPIFIWYPDGQTTNAINVTTPGTYVVMVIDPADGCFIKYDFNVSIDPPININPIITNEHCVGSLDGEILSNVSGGNPGYTYLWDDGTSTFTTADLTGLAGNPAVNYSLTVTDASGCTATISGLQVLTNYPGNAISYSATITDAACPGSCNGEIEISSTVPGIANLVFNWSTGSTSHEIKTLCEGSYSVTINNAPIPFGPPTDCPYYETYVVGTNAPSNWQVFSENSSGNTEVVDVEKDDNNNVYVMGNFHGTAEFQGVTINSGASPSGVYIAMYDQCGELRWIAHTEEGPSPNIPSYTARDMEFRDGHLHFMFHYDVDGAPLGTGNIISRNPSSVIIDFNSINRPTNSNHTIGRIDPSGVFHDVSYLVNPTNWNGYSGPPDSLRAIDWFENTGNYVVAGRVDGRAFIAETNFGTNYTISTNRTDVSTTPQNGIDIVNDIEYYPDLDIHSIYLTGKFRNAGVLNGNLVNSLGQYDVFVGVMEITDLDSGFSIGGTGTIFYNNQSYATIYAEGVELDYRKVSGSLFDIYVVGNYEGDFIHPNGWGSIGNSAPNAFVTHLLNDFTLVSYVSKVSFNDAPSFDNVRGTGVFVDEFDRVYAVGTYKAAQLEQIPGSYTQGGNINFTNMWNLCLNTNMSHRWINGGHNHADVKVSGVTAFNRNAFVGGSYDDDLDFYDFGATPFIPYAGITSYESFLARYGEHSSPGSGPFHKKEDAQNSEKEDVLLSMIESSSFEVRVAPNPVMQQMQIQLKSDKQEAWNYSIYSLTGSIVMQSPNIPVLQNQVQWDAGSLPSGIYLLRVQQGENVQNIRFVKH